MGNEIEAQYSLAVMPVFGIREAIERRKIIIEYTRELMVAGRDYGAIPGTDKNTLLKPGAEKLCSLFGLTPRFPIVDKAEDWTGERHGGEPFFYYLVKCSLWRGDHLIAEGDGSCNSWEKKYRWREEQRKCPQCEQAAIIKGKKEYGGGWLCFKKKGGCGAKFKDGDASIEGQTVGAIPNPDICDLPNTILKMAQKRALVGATLIAVNASEFFTQDIEDFADYPETVEAVVTRVPEPSPELPTICSDCEHPIANYETPQGKMVGAPAVAKRNLYRYGRALCMNCAAVEDMYPRLVELQEALFKLGCHEGISSLDSDNNWAVDEYKRWGTSARKTVDARLEQLSEQAGITLADNLTLSEKVKQGLEMMEVITRAEMVDEAQR